MVAGHSLDRAVDEGIYLSYGLERTGGAKVGEIVATHGGAFTGAQQHSGVYVGSPAFTQAPGALYSLSDASWTLSRRTKELGDGLADNFAKYRAEGLVVRCTLKHGGS